MDELITVTPETIPTAEIENLSNYLNNNCLNVWNIQFH